MLKSSLSVVLILSRLPVTMFLVKYAYKTFSEILSSTPSKNVIRALILGEVLHIIA